MTNPTHEYELSIDRVLDARRESGGPPGGALCRILGSLRFFLEPFAARLGILAFCQGFGESCAHILRALRGRAALGEDGGCAESE